MSIIRSPRFRAALATVAAATATAGVFTAPSALAGPDAHPAARHRASISWSDCGGGFECGRLRVPLDYDHQRGAKISLALIRLPATDPDHRVGSVFLNPGGPGNSGVDAVRQDARTLFSDTVRSRFDIVGFDPRGVARSAPVQCFTDAAAQQAFDAGRPAFPVGRTETADFTDGSAELAQSCGTNGGELLSHMSTANTARDLNRMRTVVHDHGLTFVGQSYGTFLGETYSALFPGHVRALVLDGVTDPVAWSTGHGTEGRRTPFSARLGSAEATFDTMRFFLDECQDAGAQGCAFAGAHTRAKFDGLIASLRRQPAVLQTPDGPLTLTYADVVDGLRGGLQFPPIWPDLAGLLQATADGVDADGSVARVLGSTAASATSRAGAGEPYDNSRDALLATACADTVNPGSAAAWPRAARELDERAPYWGSDWTFLSQPCASWPVQDHDRYLGPYGRATTARPLLLHAQHDAASPLSAARRVERLMPGARLLTLEGAAHPATVTGNGCMLDAMQRYLLRGALPVKGAVCATEARPFS